jgi:hypothetical protein
VNNWVNTSEMMKQINQSNKVSTCEG